MSQAGPAPILCDIDGVIWLDHHPIPGSADAIAGLREAGHRVLFVTNNSAALVEHHEEALANIGIPAVGDVVTSSQAAAQLTQPGERVLIGGGPGIAQAVNARGAEPVETGNTGPVDAGSVDAGSVDAVVVGLYRAFDYAWLTAVSNVVRGGARFIATNDDATYPTPRGPEPGGGTIVAAVATASGVEPTIAGKPNPPMVAVVADRLGRDVGDLGDVIMIGDRLSTDAAFAQAIDCRFALVRTGVTTPDDIVTQQVDFDGPNLAAVATASGVEPTIAGKPNPPMVAVVADRLGRDVGGLGDVIMIGDRLSTDAAFAQAIECRFALVRTGVTAPGDVVTQQVDFDGPNLAAVTAQILST